ncbi:GNAT family N-acetyltransferase [Dactylosporangium sp. NPDC051485]|uniref:GNAT family N-acetyltransferase n=1 Tax=Dactylosporangium sp. NPDC051485 TaxID=3154846 RepID=UPI003428CCEB
MLITPLCADLIDQVADLMRLGEPYVTVRDHSDYWLYSALFASTCPVAVDDGTVTGAVIAMRSQDQPADVYVQDAVVHPDHRRGGVATTLVASIAAQAHVWGCRRLFLTCAPGNTVALTARQQLGFRNLPGDATVDGVHVISSFKGPGRDRAVFQLDLPTTAQTPQPDRTAGADA